MAAKTRLSLDGYGARRYGSFAGKTSSATHPVGILTRLSLDGYGVRRYGSFAGKTASTPTPTVTPTPVQIPAGGAGYVSGRKRRKLHQRSVRELYRQLPGFGQPQPAPEIEAPIGKAEPVSLDMAASPLGGLLGIADRIIVPARPLVAAKSKILIDEEEEEIALILSLLQ